MKKPMKKCLFLLSVLSLFVSASHSQVPDTVQIQPFPITDLIPFPIDEDVEDVEIDEPFFSDTTKLTKPKSMRTGAVCNDGSISSATGGGACSGHGGVKHWLYGDKPSKESKSITPKKRFLKSKKTSIDDGDYEQGEQQLSPITYAPPQALPHPVSQVAEIFGQVVIMSLLFLIVLLVAKKAIEKI